jgi:Fe-S oxidoreductase
MAAFRQFKRIWDPENKMNPGKKVDAYSPTDNLRLGNGYYPKPGRTHFRYPDDEGTFAHATERCVGVGECRREHQGTMCPSFRVTHEEKHSTRGRTHLLFETLRGGLPRGWRDEAARDALDLCLSCKGCKGDCPVQVDVATLKAEFLAHYYRGRLRPRVAYTIGGIYRWARLASHMPRLANAVAQSRGLGRLLKKIGGLTPERSVPAFAEQTFRQWWSSRPPRNEGREPVILWNDTFNNFFTPEVAIAAVECLEDAGFAVSIPAASLCCGRPLYDYGLLKKARKYLERILSHLEAAIREGIPIVGLEPSCVAVFRDELGNLMPDDEQARRLKKQTFLFSEFLNQKAGHYIPPRLEGRALAQIHCHHKAVLKSEDEKELLQKMGLELELLDGGCCGLAGSFGFEADHFEISKQIFEYEIGPRIREVRARHPETWILADGFSCQHQITELCGVKPLHVAQVMQKAIRRRKKTELPLGDEQSAA